MHIIKPRSMVKHIERLHYRIFLYAIIKPPLRLLSQLKAKRFDGPGEHLQTALLPTIGRLLGPHGETEKNRVPVRATFCPTDANEFQDGIR